MNTAAAPMGHNQPPSEIEMLQTRLNDNHSVLMQTAEKRIANAGKVPKVCKDDATAQKITDLIKLLNSVRQEMEKTHKVEKEPFLTGGRAVDGFFNTVIARIKRAADDASRPLTAFNMHKASEIKRLAAEQVEKERLEAEKHANAGHALQGEGMHAAAGVAFAEAEVYDRRADAAEEKVTAKPGQLVQTRSQTGAVASLRTKWVGTVIDRNLLDLETLRPYIHVDALATAVNAFVRAGWKQLKGAEIKEVPLTSVR